MPRVGLVRGASPMLGNGSDVAPPTDPALWLIHLTRSEELPTSRSAFIAGAVMALGIVDVPGILEGIDDQDAAPTWLLVAGASWVGTYLLLPIWAARFARSGLSQISGSSRCR